jgi:DNA-binding transcriptional ArsR family regulator
MEDQSQIERDRQKAEVFDALGHPTRILILKVLREGSLGFADLKKKTSIDSSGHLQHHLTKLNGLIKTEYGKYCLSDEGKDALLTVQTVENSSSKKEVKGKGYKHFRLTLKPVAFLLATLLIVSSIIAVYEYNQAADNRAALQREKFAKADEFAGAYLDESNKLHIILTNNATTTIINKYLMRGNYTGIVFETADFPLSYLYAVQSALNGVMIEFGIEATALNEIANTVDIHLLDSTKQKDVIEFLKTVFNDFDDRCVAFMGPVEITLSAAESSQTLPPGNNTGFPATSTGLGKLVKPFPICMVLFGEDAII